MHYEYLANDPDYSRFRGYPILERIEHLKNCLALAPFKSIDYLETLIKTEENIAEIKGYKRDKIKILDTFTGVAGFSLALEQELGRENVEHIGFSEIEKDAEKILKVRYPEVKNYGDITKIDIKNLPDFNLLTGGFPCQDVSVSGKQTLEGGRTILVEYLLRILEEKQPENFIFENVKALTGKKWKVFFNSIITRIQEAGYNLEYKVLDTKEF